MPIEALWNSEHADFFISRPPGYDPGPPTQPPAPSVRTAPAPVKNATHAPAPIKQLPPIPAPVKSRSHALFSRLRVKHLGDASKEFITFLIVIWILLLVLAVSFAFVRVRVSRGGKGRRARGAPSVLPHHSAHVHAAPSRFHTE